jgi:hypothetical protein
MEIQVVVSWIVTSYSDVQYSNISEQHADFLFTHPEDGGSVVLRNVGILPHHCTASQSRRPRLLAFQGVSSQKFCTYFFSQKSELHYWPNVASYISLSYQQYVDSSVGIALAEGLDDRCSRVRFPAGAGDFSLHHHVQNCSDAHPASYPMGTRGSFPGGKAAGL